MFGSYFLNLSVSKVPILQVVLLFRVQLWPVAHFFHSLLGGFAFALLLHSPKSEWKKWATGQSCIRKRSTTCKIGTLAASQFCSPNYQSICKHFPRKWILDFHFFLLQKGYRQALKEDSYCAADSFWYLLTYINENLHDHPCSPTELVWVVELWWF